jgi:hypothetical protein
VLCEYQRITLARRMKEARRGTMPGHGFFHSQKLVGGIAY